MVDGLQRAIEYLVTLALIALGLGALGFFGMLGMTVSAFRTKPPRTRLVVSTALSVAAVAAVFETVTSLDTLGVIELVFGLLPTPAVLWACITWGELFDMRRSVGGAPSTRYRTMGFAGALLYVGGVIAFTWNDHGRPSWDAMFPPLDPESARPTVPVGEPIEELHTRGQSTVALTKSGRMLVVDGWRATVQPGVYTSVVTGEDAAACGLSADGDVLCVGQMTVEVRERVSALALSSKAVCRAPRGQKTIHCTTPAGKGEIEIPDTRAVSALVLDRERLFVLGEDRVVLEFDATTGKPGPLRLDNIAAAFAGGDSACFIGITGSLSCQKRGALRAIAVAFGATSGAVTDYVGCVVGREGELACWDEFSRSEKSTVLELDAKVDAVWPGSTFDAIVRLGPDRFLSVDSDLRTQPVVLPQVVYAPQP